MKQILFICIFCLFGSELADTAATTKNVSFVYGSSVDLVCDATGNFFSKSSSGVTTQITSTTDTTHYSISGNTLTISDLMVAQITNDYVCNSSTDSTTFTKQSMIRIIYNVITLFLFGNKLVL